MCWFNSKFAVQTSCNCTEPQNRMLYIYSGHAFDLNNGLWVWVFSSSKGPEFWDPSLSKRFVQTSCHLWGPHWVLDHHFSMWILTYILKFLYLQLEDCKDFKLLQYSPGSIQIMCENRKGLSGCKSECILFGCYMVLLSCVIFLFNLLRHSL